MTFVIYVNIVSPHQLPLAREIAKRVGDCNFMYVYTDAMYNDRRCLGWDMDVPQWCVHVSEEKAKMWLVEADVMLSGVRAFDLFEERAAHGKKNLYMSERWFKPRLGILKMLHPMYFSYGRKLCRLVDNGSLVLLPIGVHSAYDMARLCGVMHGNLKSFSHIPKFGFEPKPCGKIYFERHTFDTNDTYCLKRMRVWGYFVEPGTPTAQRRSSSPYRDKELRVLWVGRLLPLKRVDTIIRAICECKKKGLRVSLDVYGAGPDELRLRRMAVGCEDFIWFHSQVPISEVRQVMHEHDVFIMASDAHEGWGAVVSEAMEEGVCVMGSCESGACATMLPKDNLFKSGDWKSLSDKLLAGVSKVPIGDWTAANAAQALIEFAGDL